jgi:hypothetical protein
VIGPTRPRDRDRRGRSAEETPIARGAKTSAVWPPRTAASNDTRHRCGRRSCQKAPAGVGESISHSETIPSRSKAASARTITQVPRPHRAALLCPGPSPGNSRLAPAVTRPPTRNSRRSGGWVNWRRHSSLSANRAPTGLGSCNSGTDIAHLLPRVTHSGEILTGGLPLALDFILVRTPTETPRNPILALHGRRRTTPCVWI